MVYLQHRSFLPDDHVFHSDKRNFAHKTDPKKPPASKTQAFIKSGIIRFSEASTGKAKKKVVQKYGCKGEYAMQKLPNHDRMHSTPVEPMHACY